MAWFVAALILFIAELFVGSFYLLIISFSLVGAGLAAFLFEHSAVPILTAVMIASVGLYWVQRYSKRHKNQAEAVHDDLDIGQTVQIVRHLHDQIYEVFYRGSYWQARVMNTTHLVAAHTTASIVGTGQSHYKDLPNNNCSRKDLFCEARILQRLTESFSSPLARIKFNAVLVSNALFAF